MTIPVAEREQILISSTGAEKAPVGIITKGAYWVVYSRFNNIYLKEFGGTRVRRVRVGDTAFYLTQAQDASYNILSDRFWLWEIQVDKSLHIVEIEPVPGDNPIIHNDVQIAAGISNIRADVQDGRYPRALILLDTIPNKTLELRVYEDVMSGAESFSSELNWAPTRLDDLALTFDADQRDNFKVGYSDVASPPNIYEEGYVHPAPVIASATPTGDKQFQITWNAVPPTEIYVLERAEDINFTVALTDVYSGATAEYTDTVPAYFVDYWYRVKATIPSADMESIWSDPFMVTAQPSVPLLLRRRYVRDDGF